MKLEETFFTALAKIVLVSTTLSTFITFLLGMGTYTMVVLSTMLVLTSPVLIGLILYAWSQVHAGGAKGPADWSNLLEMKDKTLAEEFNNNKIPMEIAYEAYINGKMDVKKDFYELLRDDRNKIFRFNFTRNDASFYFKTFILQSIIHSKSADKDDIRPVYDRGNDFYGWFLGETMIYTSAVFEKETDTLEEAQFRKLKIVCEKVQLKKGETLLDIGCGWGTLAVYAAKNYGVKATGVTLAKEQRAFAMEQAAKAGVENDVNILCMDYREIPMQKFNKITCLEMAEHVGVLKFPYFMDQVYNMLEDDGIFYIQIAGLRRPWQFEDFVWGLFMAKYIFPGADASCPLGFTVNNLERAGFEVQSVVNVGIHYSLTIYSWYKNWLKNREAVVGKYGEWWFRLWVVFLAWSTLVAAQGNSTCYQIVAYKNKDVYNRRRFIGHHPDHA